jgi:hypothetical protein
MWRRWTPRSLRPREAHLRRKERTRARVISVQSSLAIPAGLPPEPDGPPSGRRSRRSPPRKCARTTGASVVPRHDRTGVELLDEEDDLLLRLPLPVVGAPLHSPEPLDPPHLILQSLRSLSLLSSRMASLLSFATAWGRATRAPSIPYIRRATPNQCRSPARPPPPPSEMPPWNRRSLAGTSSGTSRPLTIYGLHLDANHQMVGFESGS